MTHKYKRLIIELGKIPNLSYKITMNSKERIEATLCLFGMYICDFGMQFHDDMIDDTGTVIKWGGMDIHLSCINEINFSLILIVGDTLHSIDGLITYVLLEIMVQKE